MRLLAAGLILIAIAPSAPSLCSNGSTGSRRISLLVIGYVSPSYNPFSALAEQDPLFVYKAYPLPPDLPDPDKRKLDRIYYPRSRRQLVEAYDAIVFTDARIRHFSSRQFSDLEYAFRDTGMASVTIHGPSWEHVWSVTVLYDLSPVKDFQIRFYLPWRVRFRRDRDPVFLPFVGVGMEKVTGSAYGLMEPKLGSTVWADMVPQNSPWLVSWRPAGDKPGMQWVFADKFDKDWWALSYGTRGNNPYAIDLCANLLLYSLGRPLITDIHARFQAREMLTSFQTQKGLILSMIEWAEKFGANGAPLNEKLSELEEEAERAVNYYIQQDYESAISFMSSMNSRINAIAEEAVRLKDAALLWVYFSEWAATCSTFLVSGVLLWSLMVRRRMYRAVEASRLERIR